MADLSDIIKITNAQTANGWTKYWNYGCCTSSPNKPALSWRDYLDENVLTTSDQTYISQQTIDMLQKYGYLAYSNEGENLSKEETEMNNTSNNTMNGIFGRVAPGMCRLSMSGKIAIKTNNGYKTYDVESGRLTNCDRFVFDIGEDMFFVMPTNKVKRGDIIIANGRPYCVLDAGKNDIKVFCYEDSTISTIVPERHVLMGKQFFYGKIVSMFGNVTEKNGMKSMMKFMMLSEMMKKNSSNGNGVMDILPMMMLVGGGMTDTLFDGMLDFACGEDDEEEIADEE